MATASAASVRIWLPKYHPGQEQVVREQRRFNVLCAGRRTGKALACDTPIPTPIGWTTMGALMIGDWVFDEQGLPCQVVEATPVMFDHDCYDVIFSDGSVVTADADHRWLTWTHTERKNHDRGLTGKQGGAYQPSVRTTIEIRDTLTHCPRGDINHSIDTCGPLQYPTQDVPIDPYVFGLWLGDGYTHGTEITNTDEDILAACVDAGYHVRQKGDAASITYTMARPRRVRDRLPDRRYDLHSSLQSLGVLGHKHIPELYLRADVEQRLALLQGLMDTDGTCDPRGRCEIGVCNERLANDIYDLAIGLGLKATRRRKQPTISGRTHRLDGRLLNEAHYVGFTTDMPVFRLTRKLERQSLTGVKSTQGRRYITEVRPRPSVPVRCIMVDSPSHLYLAGRACIPTHNTTLGIDRLIQPAIGGLPGEESGIGFPTAWMAPTYKMLEEVWTVVTETLAPIIDRIDKQQHRIIIRGTNAVIEFWSLDEPGSIRGRKYRRVIMDECCMVKDLQRVWQAIILPTLADYEGDAFFLSTPNGDDYFKVLFDMGDKSNTISTIIGGVDRFPEWKSWRMPTSVNPAIRKSEIEMNRLALPDLTFRQEWLAEFITRQGQVFRRIEDAISENSAQSEAMPGHRYVFGCDWGKLRDFTVITVLDTTIRAVVYMDRFQRIDYAFQVERLKALYDRFRPFTIYAEQNSVGVPIIEQLQRLNLPVVPFVTTISSKATLIEKLSLAFERAELTIPSEDYLLRELRRFQATRTRTGLIHYAAPDGEHDDSVMSLALALQGCEDDRPLILFGDMIPKDDMSIDEDDDEATILRKLIELRKRHLLERLDKLDTQRESS